MGKDEPSFIEPNRCNCTALRKASRCMSQFYDFTLVPSGLRSTQFAMLAELDRRVDTPPTIRELRGGAGDGSIDHRPEPAAAWARRVEFAGAGRGGPPKSSRENHQGRPVASCRCSTALECRPTTFRGRLGTDLARWLVGAGLALDWPKLHAFA